MYTTSSATDSHNQKWKGKPGQSKVDRILFIYVLFQSIVWIERNQTKAHEGRRAWAHWTGSGGSQWHSCLRVYDLKRYNTNRTITGRMNSRTEVKILEFNRYSREQKLTNNELNVVKGRLHRTCAKSCTGCRQAKNRLFLNIGQHSTVFPPLTRTESKRQSRSATFGTPENWYTRYAIRSQTLNTLNVTCPPVLRLCWVTACLAGKRCQ